MEENELKSYTYDAKKDIILMIIEWIGYILMFCIPTILLQRYTFIRVNSALIRVGFMIVIVLKGISAAVVIFYNTRKCLKITKEEIRYTCGIKSQSEIVIPISKVLSSKFTTSTLQKVCGTSTLYVVYTKEDCEEPVDICFEDVENGEEACYIIKQKVESKK